MKQSVSRRKWLIFPAAAAVLSALLIAVICFAIYAAEGETSRISSVTMDEGHRILSVSVTLSNDDRSRHNGKQLYLYEVYPYQKLGNIAALDSVGHVKIDSATADYSFSLPFYENTQQRYARYVCAVLDENNRFLRLTDAHYIENVVSLSSRNGEYPVFASKKGMNIQLMSDAQQLGVSHTVITVKYNEYLRTAPLAQQTTEFSYLGETYYFDLDKIEKLDYRIRTYTEAGIHVYLNLVLGAPGADQSEDLECLYADPNGKVASLYALNTSNRYAVQYYEAVVAYLAERYTDNSRQNGFAASFIVGYEVNSNRYWNYAGDMALDAYVDSYATVFRITDTALRSVYAAGRTYLSLANNFTAKSSNLNLVGVDTLDYAGRSFLEAFASQLKAQGDLPWNIAINPYSADLSLTACWADPNATSGYDTPFVSMANFEVFCRFLSQDLFLYQGQTRRIAITEFGVSADLKDSGALQAQAASYVYAYYKAESLPMVESLIYLRQVDNSGEAGLYFGLWSNVEGTVNQPAEKKPIYEVFRAIDTNSSVAAAQFALSLLGVADWTEVIPGYSAQNLTKRVVLSGSALKQNEIPSRYGKIVLFDFSRGNLQGFLPSDNAKQIAITPAEGLTDAKGGQLDHSALRADLYSGNVVEGMGVSRWFENSLHLAEVGYASLQCKVDVPTTAGALAVQLRLYSNTYGSNHESGYTVVYEGEAEITAGEWTTVCFDLRSLTNTYPEIDGMKIWVVDKSGSVPDGSYRLWLEEVSVYRKSVISLMVNFMWVGIALLILLAGGSLLLVALRLVNATKQRRARAAEERRREDANRRELERIYRQQSLVRQTSVNRILSRPAQPQPKSSHTARSAQSTQPPARPAQPTQASGATRPAQSPQSARFAQAARSAQAMQSTQSMQSAQAAQSARRRQAAEQLMRESGAQPTQTISRIPRNRQK